MFRYAAFQLPANLPVMFRIWRGTSYLALEEAIRGYAWTTNKDVACWFAMRHAKEHGSPLVLTAEVAKHDVKLYYPDRQESLVVILRPPVARLDGDESDWAKGFERQEAAIQRHNLHGIIIAPDESPAIELDAAIS